MGWMHIQTQPVPTLYTLLRHSSEPAFLEVGSPVVIEYAPPHWEDTHADIASAEHVYSVTVHLGTYLSGDGVTVTLTIP